MPRVLLCSEGGSGQGHIVRIRRIAEALSSRGATCHVALFDPSKGRALAGHVLSVLQAPVNRWGNDYPPTLQLSPEPRDACNTTFQLWELGFWNADTTAGNLKDWDAILAQIRPDVVVADFAPFALLAAADRVPTFAIGNGYFVPALIDEYFTPDGEAASDQDKAAQDGFFACIDTAFRKAGLRASEDFAKALCSDHPSPATLPALDPKYNLRPQSLAPPELDVLPDEPAQLRGNEILIYLGDDPAGHAELIESVAKTNLKARLYTLNTVSTPFKVTENLSIQTVPFSLKQIAERACLLVHHGGIGITHLGALAGVPQIVGYKGHERWSNAKALHGQGVGGGKMVGQGQTKTFVGLITHYSQDGLHRHAALDWARYSRRWIAGRRGQDVIAQKIIDIV